MRHLWFAIRDSSRYKKDFSLGLENIYRKHSEGIIFLYILQCKHMQIVVREQSQQFVKVTT